MVDQMLGLKTGDAHIIFQNHRWIVCQIISDPSSEAQLLPLLMFMHRGEHRYRACPRSSGYIGDKCLDGIRHTGETPVRDERRR